MRVAGFVSGSALCPANGETGRPACSAAVAAGEPTSCADTPRRVSDHRSAWTSCLFAPSTLEHPSPWQPLSAALLQCDSRLHPESVMGDACQGCGNILALGEPGEAEPLRVIATQRLEALSAQL